jgi:hypothetical protein
MFTFDPVSYFHRSLPVGSQGLAQAWNIGAM